MADEIPNVEQKGLEQDLVRLVKEVQTHKERPENAGLDDQQIVKMAIQSLASAAAATPTPVPTPASPTPASTQSPLPGYAQQAPAETKLEIEYLLDTALRHGLDKANEEARKTNPFVLDAFHDSLSGRLQEELRKRGLLK